MTAILIVLGLVPLLLATGPGSEIQKPLAWVVVGGVFTSTALTLVLLPVFYVWTEGGFKKASPAKTSPAPLRIVPARSEPGVGTPSEARRCSR